MRDLMGRIVDRDSFFEIGHDWGRSIITGLARWTVADRDLRRGRERLRRRLGRRLLPQAVRLIDLAATFHLPLLHLEDCPGS